MSVEKILGPKENIKAILDKLEAVQLKKEDNIINQPFITVPEVGEVTMNCLYANDEVKALLKDIVEIEWKKYGEIIDNLSWFEAMLVAQLLDLQILSAKEYWKCLDWALSNDEQFVESLKEYTWTSTLVIWNKRTKLAKDLLKSLNYKGKLPVIVDSPEVSINNNSWYNLKGGNLTVPNSPLCIPDILGIKINPSFYYTIESRVRVAVCGWNKAQREYGVLLEIAPDSFFIEKYSYPHTLILDNIGFFCKKIE